MKKIYIHYLGALLIHFGCHRVNRLGMFSPEQAQKGPIVPSQAIVESIPRPIHQAETKQLIESIPPNKAFCVLVTPEKCKELRLDFDAFVHVVYSQENKGLIFYLEKMAQVVLSILQHRYSGSSMQIQAIQVNDAVDLDQLISKTSRITGGGKYITYTPKFYSLDSLKCKIGPTNDALYAGYKALDLATIERAYNQIPYQTGPAECSVNAAARALILAGANIHAGNYVDFVVQCPTIYRSINKVSEKSVVGGFFTGIFGGLLCAIPGGQVIGLPMVYAGTSTMAVGATSMSLTENKKTASSCGVDPWDLSNHIDRYLTNNTYRYSYVDCYYDFASYEAAIVHDIEHKQPVIAFFFFTPTGWHYANIIAIKQGDSGVSEFILLDTSMKNKIKFFEIINADDMEYLTRNIYKTMTALVLWNKPNHNYYRLCCIDRKSVV